MKKEIMEEALSCIDDRFIAEAIESGNREKSVHRRRLRFVLIAASVFLLLTSFTAAALAPTDLTYYLDKAFHGGYDMIDTITAMPHSISLKTSDKRVELTMRGIVGDTQKTVVFYDITVAPGICPSEFLDNISFQTGIHIHSGILRLPEDGTAFSSSDRVLGHTENDDGSVIYQMMQSIVSKDLKQGDDLKITLRGIGYYDQKRQGNVSLLQGEWCMTFPLVFRDVTKIISCDETASLNSGNKETDENGAFSGLYDIHIREVRVSPISVAVSGELPAGKDISDILFSNLRIRYRDGSFLDPFPTILMIDDNTVLMPDMTWHTATDAEIEAWNKQNYITGSTGFSGRISDDPSRISFTCVWETLRQIDYENAEALLIGSAEIPLSEKVSEN